MYINIDLLEKSSLELRDVVLLTAIKQNAAGKKEEFLKSNLLESDLERYTERLFIKLVKGTKKDEGVYKRLRMDEKGSKLLTDLSYEGAPDEQTEILLNWLVNIYKSKSNGIVKNKKEIARRLFWFKTVTAIEGNKLALLLASFVQDSFIPENPKNFAEEFRQFKESNPRAQISNMLDNICYSPESHFDRHYTLDKSPLWRYFEDWKEHIENIWKTNNLIEI